MLAFTILLVCAQPKPLLDMQAAFVEACSCKGTCTFETTGTLPGCHALGGYRIDRGTYEGRDISGIAIAFVSAPSGDLFVYLDAKTDAMRQAGEALGKALFGEGFGKWKGIEKAAISLTSDKGSFKLLVDGGRTALLETTPVLGGDGKSAVVLRNVFGDPYDSLTQAKVARASFSGPISADAVAHGFQLKGTSAFYVERLSIRKRF